MRSAISFESDREISESRIALDIHCKDLREVFTLTFAPSSSSQFACNDHVTISVDQNCEAFVSVDEIIEGDPDNQQLFRLEVEGYAEGTGGVLISYPEFNRDFKVTVTSPEGISCWSEVSFEDKTPPVIQCIDTTLACGEPLDAELYKPKTEDGCGGEVSLMYTEKKSGDLCNNRTITRTWTATDESGNSATCVQTITITPLTLDDLEWPANYVGSCTDSRLPEQTGYPRIDGKDIMVGGVCNIFATYEDKDLDDCGGGVKIVRHWTILDWCTHEIADTIQIIKLSDNIAPDITCPGDITINVDPWECSGSTELETPEVSDLCDTPWTIEAIADTGIVYNTNGNWIVANLPLGVHKVTWTATDECGNSSTCTIRILVEDQVPPVPACDEHTTVALTEDGDYLNNIVKVAAEVFDDGSYDVCGDLTFEVRRMTSCIDFDWTTAGAGVDEIPDGLVNDKDAGLDYGPKVPFSCCDVNEGPVMVALKVTDEAGNSNTCMVEVTVQDKIRPELETPPNVMVSCEFWFNLEETDGYVSPEKDILAPIFGTILDASLIGEIDRQDVIIDDPGVDSLLQLTCPLLRQPKTWGTDGVADDNCGVTIEVQVSVYEDCTGRDEDPYDPYYNWRSDLPSELFHSGCLDDHARPVKRITRNWRVTDPSGNTRSKAQVIYVVDVDGFTESDITWPDDQEITDCPDELDTGEPIVEDDNCSLIGVTYKDKRFDFVDDACYKILREWTVIDWCLFDPEAKELNNHSSGAAAIGTKGYYTHVQVIKVKDSVAPEFIVVDPRMISEGQMTLCVEDDGVSLPKGNVVFTGEEPEEGNSCAVHVTQSVSVREQCSGEVTYDVKIFPGNGDEYVIVGRPRTVQTDSTGLAILSYNTADRGSETELTGLPYNDRLCEPRVNGERAYHRVLWTVEDGCGNQNTLEYLLRLEDCKQPTPVCVNLSSVVMPSSGEIVIWAADFNAKSFDDCTPGDDLLFSFDGDEYKPDRKYTCDSLNDNGSLTFIVEIWVADEGNDLDCNGVITWDERNKDFCTTFIIIDDNERRCQVAFPIKGDIETEYLEAVSDVEVSLKDSRGIVVNKYMTGSTGQYRFVNPFLEYTIEPSRNDEHRNGVSTLDLVRIQQHLLGIRPLDSPYKIIAADANNSRSVSALDLVEIRKLILGLQLEYSSNTSWRFVDGDFKFADPNKPWPFDEIIEFDGQDSQEDFVAVKIGDVNGSVVANAQSSQPRTRAASTLSWIVPDNTVKAGQTVIVPFNSSDFVGVLGFQQTLEYQGLVFTGVRAGLIDLDNTNMAAFDQALTLSWSSVVPRTESGILFELQFDVLSDGDLKDMLNVSSRITEAEAYTETGQGAVTSKIGLVFEEHIKDNDNNFVLYQNRPNPVSGVTVIGFNMTETANASLTVFDISGKVLRVIEGTYPAGYSEVTLERQMLNATGVVYYRLETDGFAGTKKMILMD